VFGVIWSYLSVWLPVNDNALFYKAPAATLLGGRQTADSSWRDVGVETTSEYLLLIVSVFFLSLSSRTS
jgi:hypothetical protein